MPASTPSPVDIWLPETKPGPAAAALPVSLDLQSHDETRPELPDFGLKLKTGNNRRLFGFFGRAWNRTLETIYPPSCIACRRATGARDALCPDCWQALRFIERPFCERLGTPFAMDLGQGLVSPEAFANPPVYQRARAAVCFEAGPSRDLVHRLKYGDRVELARPMAVWMARAGHELLADADVVIPVPLHRWRLLARRFNQAALLAARVGEISGVDCEPLALRRIKPTPPQVGKSRSQRVENVQGAFQVAEGHVSSVRGRKITLIDDVMTSGATVNAAARVLLRAGAKRVDTLVFARVVAEM